jgi:hypothetical protein
MGSRMMRMVVWFDSEFTLAIGMSQWPECREEAEQSAILAILWIPAPRFYRTRRKRMVRPTL